MTNRMPRPVAPASPVQEAAAPTLIVSTPGLPQPGAVVGRYTIESVVGHGNMAVVYQVRRADLLRPLAMKVLFPPELGQEHTHVERFLREVRILTRLQHPNTISFYESGQIGKLLPYYVMELLEGHTLAEELKVHGPLSPARVWNLARQILGALAEAHGLGIVHRDIKPSNLFLCQVLGRDFVKVIDFGIAKAMRNAPGDLGTVTAAGYTLGTPGYLAPELWQGRPMTPAADIFSLGLTLVELLTGEPLVDPRANLSEIIRLQLDPAPLPLPEWVVRSPLGPILQCAIRKEPKRRYAHAAPMLADLEALTAQLSEEGAATGAPTPRPDADTLVVPTLNTPPPLPGEELVGRYVLGAELPGSERYLFYRATQKLLARAVMVKILRPIPATFEDLRRRFRRELLLVGRLRHPNIALVLDGGETDTGLPFLVTEALEGCTLEDRLADGPLPDAELLPLAAQLLAALAVAHNHGIIHRNIKLASIFLCDRPGQSPQAKLLDFGLARLIEHQADAQLDLSRPGQLFGTPQYMAPEQLRGEPLGPPADLYALGLVLAVARTGERIFAPQLPLPEIVCMQLGLKPRPLPPAALDGPFGSIIRKATTIELAGRYTRAEEMLAEVEALRGGALPVPPTTLIQPPVPGVATVTFGVSGPPPGLEAQVDTLERQIIELEQQLGRQQQETQRQTKLREQLIHQTEELGQVRQELAELQTRVGVLTAELQASQAREAQTAAELGRRQQELTEQRVRLAVLSHTTDQLQDRLDRSLQAEQALRAEQEQLTRWLNSRTADSREHTIRTLQELLAARDQELSEANQQLVQAQAALASRAPAERESDALMQLKQQNRELRRQLETLREQLAGSAHPEGTARTTLRLLQEELTAASAKIAGDMEAAAECTAGLKSLVQLIEQLPQSLAERSAASRLEQAVRELNPGPTLELLEQAVADAHTAAQDARQGLRQLRELLRPEG